MQKQNSVKKRDPYGKGINIHREVEAWKKQFNTGTPL